MLYLLSWSRIEYSSPFWDLLWLGEVFTMKIFGAFVKMLWQHQDHMAILEWQEGIQVVVPNFKCPAINFGHGRMLYFNFIHV